MQQALIRHLDDNFKFNQFLGTDYISQIAEFILKFVYGFYAKGISNDA